MQSQSKSWSIDLKVDHFRGLLDFDAILYLFLSYFNNLEVYAFLSSIDLR